MKKVILNLMILVFCAVSSVYACEPCLETLDFEETVKRADLIIEGEKSGNGPLMGLDGLPDAADWIEVKIFKIFKGEEEEEYIRVNSWNGMCGYGIVIDDRRYIIFMTRVESDRFDYQYNSVRGGCAIDTYLVENNMVIFDGERISIDEFLEKIEGILNSEEN